MPPFLAIPLPFDAVALAFGSAALTWNSVFIAMGVVVGVAWGARLASRSGIDEDRGYTIGLVGIVAGIIGARLFHVVDFWDYYRREPLHILFLSESGLAIWGGIVFGGLGAAAYEWRSRLSLPDLADAGASGLILGQAIERVGGVLGGGFHGRPFDGPWAVIYTHPRTDGEQGLAVHPAIGYELLWDLALFGLMNALSGRLRPGTLFCIYLCGYGLGRLWTGVYRVEIVAALGLSQGRLLGAAALCAGTAALLVMWRRRDAVGRAEDAPT